MPELSEQYIFVRSEVRGGRKLNAVEVNPLLRKYRKKLQDFIVEEKSDGKMFKAWTQDVDEFNSELLEEGKTLLFSHKLKINIYDTLLRSFNNYAHSIQAKLAEALEKIQVENEGKLSQKIIIVTTGTKFSGGERSSGRWPSEQMQTVTF